MRPRPFAALLAVSLLGASAASAGTSIDVVFRATPGVEVLSAGGLFAATEYPGLLVSDVVMRTTDRLIAASISVAFDVSLGLRIASAVEWVGLIVPLGKTSFTFKPPYRGDGVTGGGQMTNLLPTANADGLLGGFDGFVPPPEPFQNTAKFLPAGTYHLGTIVWDTRAASYFHFHSVAAFVGPYDGFGVVDEDGHFDELEGPFTLSSGGIYGPIVPEPATAALLGLGLALLATATRRRA
jgi:hypothetical protein